jgi:hypothetical protein
LDTLQGYLEEVQRVLVALVRAANERPEPFVDHAGVLRDSKTGRRINGDVPVSDEEDEADSMRASFLLSLVFPKPDELFSIATYSFFDSYDVELLGKTRKRQDPYTVGKPSVKTVESLGNEANASDYRKGHPFSGVLEKYLWASLDVCMPSAVFEVLRSTLVLVL